MTNMTIHDIAVAEIEVPENRARVFSAEGAEALAAIIAVQGLQHPVRLRREGDRLLLVSGLHRLEAARRLGWATIPAVLSSAETADAARLEEVMENLGRNELVALDRCHHLYELKQVWERMHPQAKNGGNKNVIKGQMATRVQSLHSGQDVPEVFGFAEATAERVGLSRRAIFAAVKIWTHLAPTVRVRLAGTDLARKQTELKALSELSHAKQGAVLDLILGESEATNVAQALQVLSDGAVPNDLERKFTAALKAIATLPDELFDNVIAAHEERVIASLKRRGRI